MDFPQRAVALEWVGRTIVDRDGAEIGSCTDVFLDDDTEVTEWVRSEVAGVPVFIPAVGAVESSGNVQVIVSRADIAAAPPVGGTEHITDEEEVALYRHYGIPYSREASATVLPVGDVEQSASEVTSDDVDAEASVTSPVADPPAADPVPGPVVVESVTSSPASAGPVAVQPLAAGSVDAEQPAVTPAAPTQPVPSAGLDESSADAASTGGRGWVRPALAGLAAVAVATGLVSRARRRRRRPATRAERLAERGRAASAALSARVGPAAASASRYLDATTRTVRRRAGADKAPADVPVAATLEVRAGRRASRKRTE